LLLLNSGENYAQPNIL